MPPRPTKPRTPKVLVRKVNEDLIRFRVDFSPASLQPGEEEEIFGEEGEDLNDCLVQVSDNHIQVVASCGERYLLSKQAFLDLAKEIS